MFLNSCTKTHMNALFMLTHIYLGLHIDCGREPKTKNFETNIGNLLRF